MNLYRVSNGYIGESYVRVLIVAKDEGRALELAKEKFKSESGHYGEKYYSNLESELLGNVEEELVCEIEDQLTILKLEYRKCKGDSINEK